MSKMYGKVQRLHHGGIMTNYQCNAACRHCLYACSPDRKADYITKEAAEEICELLIKGGCRSVHIGGGEPFLDFKGLFVLLEAIQKAGIRVEYVETNGFWAVDESQAESYLRALSQVGVDTLCISLDPFHAEYVPFMLPLRLAEICQRNHFGYFLWQERFLQSLAQVSPTKAHSRAALEDQISPRYVYEIARRYGVNMGGRAVNIEGEYVKPSPLQDLLKGKPCRDLFSTDHFHVDLYGRFIPPGCTGIAIPLDEVIEGIPNKKYPALEALLSSGVEGLLNFAQEKGFKPALEYTSSCTLCFYIRKWLSENADCPELDQSHYEASLTYYDEEE